MLKQADATSRFMLKRDAFVATYAVAVEEQGKHSNLVDEVARLNIELQAAEAAQAKARTEGQLQLNAESGFREVLDKLDNLAARRRAILKAAADKVAGRSSNMLRARMRKDRMPAQYRLALQKLFEASGTQQVEEGCVDWIKRHWMGMRILDGRSSDSNSWSFTRQRSWLAHHPMPVMDIELP